VDDATTNQSQTHRKDKSEETIPCFAKVLPNSVHKILLS